MTEFLVAVLVALTVMVPLMAVAFVASCYEPD